MDAVHLCLQYTVKTSAQQCMSAQHLLYSYCVLSKDFSLHTSFTTFYRDFTKTVHTLYTKKRRKKTDLGKKEKKVCLPKVALSTQKLTKHRVVGDVNPWNKWGFSFCSHI